MNIPSHNLPEVLNKELRQRTMRPLQTTWRPWGSQKKKSNKFHNSRDINPHSDKKQRGMRIKGYWNTGRISGCKWETHHSIDQPSYSAWSWWLIHSHTGQKTEWMPITVRIMLLSYMEICFNPLHMLNTKTTSICPKLKKDSASF